MDNFLYSGIGQEQFRGSHFVRFYVERHWVRGHLTRESLRFPRAFISREEKEMKGTFNSQGYDRRLPTKNLVRLPRSCHLKDYKLNSTTERSRRTLAILLDNPESRPIGKIPIWDIGIDIIVIIGPLGTLKIGQHRIKLTTYSKLLVVWLLTTSSRGQGTFQCLKESNLLTWTLTLSLLTGWKTPSRTEDPLLGTFSIPPWLAQEPTLKYGNKHSSLQKYQFLSWVTPNEYVQRQWFRLLLINNQFNTTWSMIQSRLLGYDIFIFFLDSTSILVIFTF